jgi:HlyD family secretion protein
MNKKWLSGIAIIVILAIAGGGYYYYRTRAATAQAAKTAEPAMQTAVARRGDLVLLASGSGQLVAASQMALSFDESGTLAELNVAVGDEVKAGDLLARLQTQNSPEDIAASVATAELDVITAQQAIDTLRANAEIAKTTAMNDISTYAQAVRDAQYTLENYSMPLILQGMDTIQAVDLMKERLDAASAAFEPYKYYPVTNATRQSLLVTLNEAQSNYDGAVKRLNYEYALDVANANLAKARQDYEKYKDGPAADELSLAEATLANAQAKLALAKETQSVIELTAPMDGTVMTVSANVGEAVGTTAFITLADLKHPELDVYMDETDLSNVAVGYEADIVFDALPDQTFTGKVVSISPGLETVNNTQAVKVVVVMDPQNLSTPLLVGLNASVDVVSGRATNAVLVPVEAVRKLDEGEYAVFVMTNGKPLLRVVKVGLMDATSAQIISGVEAGDIVTTGIVKTQ